MATLGNTEVRTNEMSTSTAWPSNASTVSACQFPLQVNGAVFTSMSTYTTSTSTAITDTKLLIYSDGADAPASIIAITPAASLMTGLAQWNTINFAQPFTLNAGNYWLAIMANTNGSTNSLTSVTGKNRVSNEANTFPTPTPSFLSVTSSSFQKAIYATFTLPSVFSGTISN